MAWNMLLTGATALLGLAGIGLASQEPEFDFQVATPLGQPDQVSLVSFQKQAGVSVRFNDAHVGEVLSWLEHQGVSFVVADPKLKERTITVSIENQPLDDVADAIASALGGHWEKQGNIRIYRNGTRGVLDLYGFSKPGAQWFSLSPNQMKGGGTKDYVFQELPPDKGLQNFGGQFKVFEKDLKSGKNSELFGSKVQDLLKSNGKDRYSVFTWGSNKFDFDKFSKSLTDHQKDLMKSQGYLKLSDLTAAQRDMIGVKETPENLEIEYSKNGQTIKIKSK